jgi:hypothetical protein
MGLKVHPAVLIGGGLVAALVLSATIHYFATQNEAQNREAVKAKWDAKIAAFKAKQAAENTPEKIAERAHQAQIAALEKADRDEAEYTACRASAQCWFGKHQADAEFECAKAVERLAQYQFEWTNSIFGKSKFDRVGWANQDAGALLLAGSAIKMQNGFGAWRNMSYRCAFDSGTGNAVASAE